MVIVTLGDPLSINIEVVSKLLQDSSSFLGQKIVLIGSHWQWLYQLKKLGRGFSRPYKVIDKVSPLVGKQGGLWFYDIESPSLPTELLSLRDRGELAYKSLKVSWLFKQTCVGEVCAILTAPIHKEACYLAGMVEPGQTEFYAQRQGVESLMLLAGPKLKVGLVTNHVGLSQVASQITKETVFTKLRIFFRCLTSFFGVSDPRIAICGLNPHCGEGGHMGKEEGESIAPAISQWQNQYPSKGKVFGPLPADTVFWQATTGAFHGVLAMYHDQGLAPLKTIHFEEAVNITGGLDFFRVSPDHGPASDLFLQRKACDASFRQAMQHIHHYIKVQGHEKQQQVYCY